MPFLIDPDTEQYDFLVCSMSERQFDTILRGLKLIDRNHKEWAIRRKTAKDLIALMERHLAAKVCRAIR